MIQMSMMAARANDVLADDTEAIELTLVLARRLSDRLTGTRLPAQAPHDLRLARALASDVVDILEAFVARSGERRHSGSNAEKTPT
jgi:hypothetical protein